ncbi:MAG: hypothetical protein JSV52_10625 [Candidatus Zixiibacteriota bacterium]|nr:MAG: hypothetical protein JSV52_10625 [candidate division Zixibacteria bacterium]
MLSRWAKVGIVSLLIAVAIPFTSIGATSVELLEAFEAMYRPELDVMTTRDVPSTFELEHKDLRLSFVAGRLAFLKPVVIDSQEVVFGAYFEGQGQFSFIPPVDMEKEQLQRFFRTDSLNRSFDKMLLFFSQEIYDHIVESTNQATIRFGEGQVLAARSCCEDLTKDDRRGFIFEALSNLVHPAQRPFLLINTEPDKSDRIFYIYNPEKREEVRLLKRYSQFALSFMETVCQYSQYADPGYVNLNGLNKDRIVIDRYTIDSEIDSKADFSAAAGMNFEVTMAPTQMLRLSLHPELAVDSIRDSSGQQVAFYRYSDDEEKSWDLYLFFERPLGAGENITLEFFYQGDIIYHTMGQCFLRTGAGWYPMYGYAQRALFTLNFKTHKRWRFVATGNLINEEKTGDMVLTTWKVPWPTANVAFNVGPFQKYTFEEPDLVPVDVYFSEDLHQLIAQEQLEFLRQDVSDPWDKQSTEEYIPTGKNMHEQVAEDVINALKVYNGVFGRYPYRRMVVGEVLSPVAEAFPGFLHLDYFSWINTDSWGKERRHRAHEVAHQWWGVGVGYETYHDQWLSEGLAEYSALMYLQVVAGNDQFLDQLRKYRNDVFSARQYLFGSGEEAGPIALGYRTSSTKTRGDYRLIVYKKAALVVHMLRNLLVELKSMNENRFRAMMQDLFLTHRGNKITTQDFRRLTEKHAGIDMGWFFDQWVYRSELPTYEFTWDYEASGRNTFTAYCKVVTTGVPDDFMMYVPLEIEIEGDSKAYIRVLIEGPVYEFSLPDLPRVPRNLRLNPFESVLAKVKQ